jgi:SAM-dependent methyltransferase
MQLSSKKAVLDFLRDKQFSSVLDAPSGDGWLAEGLSDRSVVCDGIDLYEDAHGYRKVWRHDLNAPLPPDCGLYDLICCCEGLEHIGNPLQLLASFHSHLSENGWLVVTTPNVWYPQSRLQFLMRGFFPSFPPLAGKISPGDHMHITPWSWPQLYLYLKLAGFQKIEIVPEPLSSAKHLHELLFALPARGYCRSRKKRARSDEEIYFWDVAGSDASLLGRHLIVTARKGLV